MAKEITKWDEIVGNKNQKEIIINAIGRNSLPSFMLFTGSSGIGKSTFAKMTAKTLLCEEPDPETGEPCGRCLECLGVDTGSTNSYIKINMPKIFKKVDIDAKIEEIFKIQKIAKKTVYILEEIHGLSRELQTLLLEELTKIPEDVWIISCTTRPYELLPEILNRALEFKLQDPTKTECERFAKSLAKEYGISIQSDVALSGLVEMCDYSPRKISETIRVVSTDDKLTEEALSKMFSMVDSKSMCKFIGALATEKDIYEFIASVQELQETSNLSTLVRRTLDCMYDYVLAVAGGIQLGKTTIKPDIAKQLSECFDGVNKERLVIIMSILGVAGVKEHESKSSQKSKLINCKIKIDKALEKQSTVINNPAKASGFRDIVDSKPTITLTSSASKITTASEMDKLLMDEGIDEG